MCGGRAPHRVHARRRRVRRGLGFRRQLGSGATTSGATTVRTAGRPLTATPSPTSRSPTASCSPTPAASWVWARRQPSRGVRARARSASWTSRSASWSAATSSDLKDWQLDAAGRSSALYYVTVTVANVGDLDLSGRRIPLYVLDGAGALVESSSFKTDFDPCPSPALPEGFVTGEKITACQAYLVPKRGDLKAVAFRADREVQPDHLGRQGANRRAEEAALRWLRRARKRPSRNRRSEVERSRCTGSVTGARDLNHDGSAIASGAPRWLTMARDRPADLADPRVADGRDAGGAGADGGHHQRGVPAAVRASRAPASSSAR